MRIQGEQLDDWQRVAFSPRAAAAPLSSSWARCSSVMSGFMVAAHKWSRSTGRWFCANVLMR
jgi:hypothetical protein